MGGGGGKRGEWRVGGEGESVGGGGGGALPSRFRMPAADGSLVEFDSYTEVDGEAFTTVMRPRA